MTYKSWTRVTRCISSYFIFFVTFINRFFLYHQSYLILQNFIFLDSFSLSKRKELNLSVCAYISCSFIIRNLVLYQYIVLFSYGCHIKYHRLGSLKNRNEKSSHRSGVWKIQDQIPVNSISSEKSSIMTASWDRLTGEVPSPFWTSPQLSAENNN